MPWKKSDGTYIQEGKAWVGTDGSKYPAVWTRFSDTKLKSFGLTWEDPPASPEPYNAEFYSGRDKDGKLIEKELADSNAVDENGKAVLDPITGKQMVTLGVKSIWLMRTREEAKNMLSKHDWVVTRKIEKDIVIPSEITTYRDNIRTACATIETKINNCSSITEFKALFDIPVDKDGKATGKAPIYDFPDEI